MAQDDATRLPSAAQAALLDEPDFLRELVQQALQTLIEAEMEAHLAAGRYERTPDGRGHRSGHRNGYKPRTLRTRVGTLELLVPRDRAGTFSTDLLRRYQRGEQALVLTWMEMYLQGVSTRKVAAITEQLCGMRFSKSQVSTLTMPGTRLRVRCALAGVAGAAPERGCLSLPDGGCPLRESPAGRADRQPGGLAGQCGAHRRLSGPGRAGCGRDGD